MHPIGGRPEKGARLSITPDVHRRDKDPNKTGYRTLNFPRTARIICDGTVYIKEGHRSAQATWTEADEVTAASFFLLGDNISVQL